MPKCPKCKEEIEHLIEFQKELTAVPVTLDSSGNDFNYESGRDLEPEPLAAPYWACPECFDTLFTAKNKMRAIAFLKGVAY